MLVIGEVVGGKCWWWSIGGCCRCWLSRLVNVGVDVGGGGGMLVVHEHFWYVGGRCWSSMLVVDVGGRCWWSMLVVDVGGRCWLVVHLVNNIGDRCRSVLGFSQTVSCDSVPHHWRFFCFY
eukprot:Lithocolla_globosa_v1_NODE_1545_length_2495_cov_33.624180.p2 type:complete len:121 gc:universal NODE_1545_length_2495_cov_33.624180:2300-1938(-)